MTVTGQQPPMPDGNKREALLRHPGTAGVVVYQGCLRRVAECACCNRERPLYARGLCQSCYSIRLKDGTAGSYGYVRADRMQEFARLRSAGYPVAESGIRVGVCARTAGRYETALAASGQAPWRERGVKAA